MFSLVPWCGRPRWTAALPERMRAHGVTEVQLYDELAIEEYMSINHIMGTDVNALPVDLDVRDGGGCHRVRAHACTVNQQAMRCASPVRARDVRVARRSSSCRAARASVAFAASSPLTRSSTTCCWAHARPSSALTARVYERPPPRAAHPANARQRHVCTQHTTRSHARRTPAPPSRP